MPVKATTFRHKPATNQAAPPPSGSRFSGAWLVMAGAALWGTTGTAQALAPEAATPLTIGTLRLVFGALVLLIWARWRGRLVDPRGWPRHLLIVGALGIAAYQLCFFAAVERTGVAVGTIVGIGSAPVLAGVLGYLIRGEQLSSRWFVATGLAVAGCALLTLSGEDIGVDPLGILLAVGAGGTYVVYALASKILLEQYSPDAVMAWVFGFGALLLLPVLAIEPVGWALGLSGLLVVLHLGLLTVGLAYALFARGLMSVPSSTAVTLSLAEPLTAGLLGVGLLGEKLSLPAALGILLLGLGLWWLTGTRRARPGEARP